MQRTLLVRDGWDVDRGQARCVELQQQNSSRSSVSMVKWLQTEITQSAISKSTRTVCFRSERRLMTCTQQLPRNPQLALCEQPAPALTQYSNAYKVITHYRRDDLRWLPSVRVFAVSR